MTNAIPVLGALGALASVAGLFSTIWASLAFKRQTGSRVVEGEGVENRLSPDLTYKAVQNLTHFAQGINPDCIVGLNRGGSIVGAWLALQLNVKDEQFVKCFVDPLKEKAECPTQSLFGKILVIDDISRSGKTLQIARRHLMQKRRNNQFEIVLATLIACSKDGIKPVNDGLAYFPFLTKDEQLRLPWTQEIVTSSYQNAAAGTLSKEVVSVMINVIEREQQARDSVEASPSIAPASVSAA
jgi:hypoxanthine phosphoribosyltransferase